MSEDDATFVFFVRRELALFTRPLAKWDGFLCVLPDELCGRDLFFFGLDCRHEDLSDAYGKLGPDYAAMFARHFEKVRTVNYEGFLDLSQNADRRPRISKEHMPCFALATGCTHIWMPKMQRCLSGTELMAAEGFACSELAANCFSAPLLAGVETSSRSVVARWAGHVMHVGVVGSIFFGSPSWLPLLAQHLREFLRILP